MADSAQDRHLPASQRKIKKAREEGQVARSRDLGHFAAIAAGGALLAAMAPAVAGWLKQLLASGLQFDARTLAEPDAMTARLAALGLKMMWLVLPLGGAMLAVALAASVVSGGWNWTTKPMAPNFGKLNPLAGFGRMFSKHQLGETGKACVLALVLGTIGALYLRAQLPAFMATLGAAAAGGAGAGLGHAARRTGAAAGGAGAVRADRRAAAAQVAARPPEDEPPGTQGGVQATRGQRRSQGAR